mgnify:FL=1
MLSTVANARHRIIHSHRYVETGHFSRFCEGHKIYGIKHKTYGIKHRIGRYYQNAEDLR